MMVVDLLVASIDDRERVASWALLKSILFIGSPLVLLGIDHALVRSPDLLRKASPIVGLQAVGISIVLGFLLQLVVDVPWIGTTVSILAVSATSFAFAALRARGHLLWAQVALQGWKLFLVASIVWMLWMDSPDPIPSRSLVFTGSVASLLVVVVIGRADRLLLRKTDLTNMEDSIRDLYRAGAPFVATMVLLNLSLFLEQLLLNTGSSSEESARLFSHTSVVLPLIVFGNGFVNFWLGAQARQDGNRFIRWWTRFRGLVPIWSVGAALLGLLVGWQVVVTSPLASFDFEWRIALALAAVGALRTSFVIPSSYIAVWARPSELHRFVRINALGVTSFIVIFFALTWSGYSAILAALAGSLANWCLRVFSAYSPFLPVLARESAPAE